MGFFRSVMELANTKKTLAAKQAELNQILETIAQNQELLADKKALINKLDTQIANRDTTIAEIKAAAHAEQTAIIEQYDEKRIAAEKSCLEAIAAQEAESKKLSSQMAKLQSMKTLLKAIQNAVKNYDITDPTQGLGLTKEQYEQLNEIVPTVTLQRQSDSIKDLRQQNRENEKRLEEILGRYESRYSTKSNKAIYQLMVIALRAELQNILTNIKYEKLDKCLDDLRNIIARYLKIASDGSQTIAPTLNKFIAEIHVIFEAIVRTEYEYYVRKEQARAEQQAIREQMRQEAEERKLLEQQQKQVEKEESKYQSEIENIQQQIAKCENDEKAASLQKQIAELEAQLNAVAEKKEAIISRQNGQAGYVYIISNLGSFGENTFKVGMTRRLDPMERVKELGDASVPFSFDVHSFIFSDNAATLETELHHRLDEKRKNKINLRKEFFDVSIDELERLVQEINPAAEFTRTMLATEFRQSQSMA